MFRAKVCARCKESGSGIFSRCGHILHESCFRFYCCPECKLNLSNRIEIEEIYINMGLLNLCGAYLKKLEQFCKKLFCYSNNINSFGPPDLELDSYNSEILKTIDKLGWDINNEIYCGYKLFFRACEFDFYDNLNLLIEHGFDFQKYGPKGLEYSCLNSSFHTFDRLVALGVIPRQNIIFDLLLDKKFEMAKRVIQLGIDVNMTSENGKRPIHVAAKVHSIEMIHFLVDHGADFMAIDNDGNSIIHYACLSRNRGDLIFKHFLDAGFDLSCINNNDDTPLMLAIVNNNCSIANFLIKEKSGINTRNIYGYTPLFQSLMSYETQQLAKSLLESGVDLNIKTKGGKTSLHICCEFFCKTSEIIMDMILENDSDVAAMDDYGKTALSYLSCEVKPELRYKLSHRKAHLTSKFAKLC